MKKILILGFVLIIHSAFCQNFSSSNVTLTFKGLTTDFQNYFKGNFSSLISNMNKLEGLDKSLVPITINITYDNENGFIQMTVNYDHLKQMEKLPKLLKGQLDLARRIGSNGFSIYMPDLLMLCLNDFKENTLKSSKFNSEIKKFKIKVRLKKADGSWIQFYCAEYIDYYGIPRYTFQDFADIKYLTNTLCRIEALNGSKLDDYKLWELGNAKNPDGSINCETYVNKFFEIE